MCSIDACSISSIVDTSKHNVASTERGGIDYVKQTDWNTADPGLNDGCDTIDQVYHQVGVADVVVATVGMVKQRPE